METDWNKLIELYLSGDLSVEGKEAFEKELLYNTELQDELFTHRSIQQAAQRAHQRDLVVKAGANYYFYKKLNYFIITAVVLISALSLTCFLRTNSESKTESKVELLVETSSSENDGLEKMKLVSNDSTTPIVKESIENKKENSNSLNQVIISNTKEKLKNVVSTKVSNDNKLINESFESDFSSVSISAIEIEEKDTTNNDLGTFISPKFTVDLSDTLIPVFEGFKGDASISYTTTDDISTKSILKKSTRSLMVNSVIYVPEGSFLIVSEKKNDPVLVRNKFDNTDQIQEIGGMTFPKEKLVRKKDLEGNYYYCLPTGEYLFNQLLVVKEKSIDTLKSDDVISGVIEYQLITPTTEIKQVSKPFESAIGTNFSKSLKGTRRKQKVTDEKIKK